MSKQIKMVIPQTPLSINETRGMNIHKLKRIKDMWVDEVWVAYAKNRPTLQWQLKKAKISIKIFFKTNAKRDADNYPCKEVIDAIKNNGLIMDDNYDVIGRPEIDITGRDRKNSRTEITIEEIADAKNKISKKS